MYGTYVESESESCSVVSDFFATPWTIQSVEFPRPEYWSGWLFPSPGDFPNPEIEPRSPTLQAVSLPAESQEKLNLNSYAETFPQIPLLIQSWV